MKKIKIIIPILIVVILIVVLITIANASTGFEDPEATKIIATMEHVYAVLDEVGQTGDVSQYTEVFVDTSDYTYSSSVKEFVGNVLGPIAAEKGGYLTAMQAKGIANSKGDQLLKAALDKANSENRDLTTDELQQLIKENYGRLPGIKVQSDEKSILTYKKLNIYRDKAIMTYDDGQALQEATLVKINDKWFVSNIKPIVIHF